VPGFPFLLVDAFTDRPLAGNACAVVLDADGLDDAAMLAIARETNQAETAFVRRSATADFGVRFFTPAEEIPMAGHPTLATAAALVDAGRVAAGRTELVLEMRVGPVRVEITAGDPRRIVMTQPAPRFLATHPAEVLSVFGLRADDALPGVPIQTVSTGTPMLMAPIRSLDALRRARMDVAAYDRLRARSDFFSPHLFCLEGATPAGRTFARQFGSPPDLPEDPFTGSATGAMGAYLWRHGLIDSPRFVAQQGHWMGRPGEAEVEVLGPRDDVRGVRVGGGAVVVVRGELRI
jgi:trans-2,3-dihydro-3-hydroxyanthranilate isomerase